MSANHDDGAGRVDRRQVLAATALGLGAAAALPAQVAQATPPARGGPMPGDVRTYGARGDGTTDDTRAIRAALAANDIVYLPPTEHGYVITDTLVVDGKCLWGGNTVIRADRVPAGRPAIALTGNTLVQPRLQALEIRALHPIRFDAREHRPGSIGIRIATNHLVIDEVALVNYDRTFAFGDHAYVMTIRNCYARWCHYGFRWAEIGSDSGENVRVERCSFSNCVHGIAIDAQAFLFFEGCSFDYNLESNIEDIRTGGDDNMSAVYFSHCHFENGNNTMPEGNVRITVSSRAFFNNCVFFENGGTPKQFRGTGEGAVIALTDCTVIIGGEEYLAEGELGRYLARNLIHRYQRHPVRLTPRLSGCINNHFQDGNANGWLLTGVAAHDAIVEGGARQGRYCCVLPPGATLTQKQRIYVPPGTSRLVVSAQFKNLASGWALLKIMQVIDGAEGPEVAGQEYIGGDRRDWTHFAAEANAAPCGGWYYARVEVPQNNSGPLHCDDFYWRIG